MIGKRLRDLVVRNWLRLRTGTELRFGDDDEYVVHYDSEDDRLYVEYDGPGANSTGAWAFEPGGPIYAEGDLIEDGHIEPGAGAGEGEDLGIDEVLLFSGSSRGVIGFSGDEWSPRLDITSVPYPFDDEPFDRIEASVTGIMNPGEGQTLDVAVYNNHNEERIEASETTFDDFGWGGRVTDRFEFNYWRPIVVNLGGRVTGGTNNATFDRVTFMVHGVF